MKKNFMSIVIALFAILAFSQNAKSQIFEVVNSSCLDLEVSYCSMTLPVPNNSTSVSTTNTCTIMPCSFTVKLPSSCGGTVITVPLCTPCPTYNSDYSCSSRISTGCTSCPSIYFDFSYDGGPDNIMITLY